MTFSKTKLFGFLALSCSLIACGQTQASTSPNATPSDTPNAIAQTTTAPQPTASPIAVAKSPEPQASAMASTETVAKTKQFVDCDNDGKVDDEWRDLNGTKTCVRNAKNPDESLAEIEPAIFPKEEIDEDAHKQFEKLANQPCDRQTKDGKNVRYMICTVKGGDGKPRIISASATSTVPDLSGDGTGYWFAEDGTVAAIIYFHSGELFVFSGDRLLAELIQAKKVVVNGEEKFQKRTANRDFPEQQRKRLEDAAKNGGKDILSKFK
jgi:hypothetical protein